MIMTESMNLFFFADVFPASFEGAKVMVNKGLSNHFQISHTLNMSSIIPSGYRFGATYVGTKQYSPTEVRFNNRPYKLLCVTQMSGYLEEHRARCVVDRMTHCNPVLKNGTINRLTLGCTIDSHCICERGLNKMAGYLMVTIPYRKWQ